MERLEKFRNAIIEILNSHKQGNYTEKVDVETQIWIDKENDHYQLLCIGWEDDEQIYFTIMHFDIKGDKIWIQRNTSDIPVDLELLKLGISKEDIVLGLQPPSYRKFTEYAVA
ncbi:MAG: XisI protein [Leptospiraceae bacterium]|nr:XisI protein [Leptospiraceae bacterium]